MSKNQVVGRSKKSLWDRSKDGHGDSHQPSGLRRLFSPSLSRSSSRALSPIPSKWKSDIAPATAGASSSTSKIRPDVDDDSQLVAGANATIPVIRLDDRVDEKSDNDQNSKLAASTDGSQDQKNQNIGPKPNTDAANLAEEDNMWSIAEAQLRQDEKKNKLLDAYYNILESKLGNLVSSGTPKTPEQISAFIVSESERFQDTSKLGTFSSMLKNAADCILKTQKVISAAVQPCLPASIACAGVMLVLSLYIQASSQRDILYKGLDEIPHVIYDLAVIEAVDWTKTQEPVIKKSMTELCSHILEFLAKAACHLKKHPITQTLKDMFNQGEWDVLLSAIRDAEARITNHSRVEQRKEVRIIREALEKDQLTQQAATISKETVARNEKIAAFLKELHEHAWPGGDSYENSKERVQRAEEGTCKWLTNHGKFKAWESPDNPNPVSPLLLLTALPGSGKSVLSKHLIDTVLPRPKDRVVCYFFFKDDFEHQKSATKALCTLLHQLLRISELRGRTPPADSALWCFETIGKESFFGSVSSLWKTFTEAALHTDAGEVICILDALDECRPNDRKELIKAINQFYQTPRDQEPCLLKFFLTTRPYGDIQSQFSYAWGHRLPEIRLAGEQDDISNDIADEIKIVVGKRIDQICDMFHLTKQKTNLMKMNLGAAPGRTYLWITLVFDDLLKKTSGINKEYIESFVKNPPKDVDDAYEKILNRSKTQSPGNQDLKKTRNILRMVVAARRPLTLQEISIALPLLEHQPPYEDLADEIESKEGIWDIVRDCCGLLIIRVDDRLYLLHQTVREFLVATSPNINSENQKSQDTPDSGTITPYSYLWKDSIELADANSVLAEACISYLHSNFAKTDDSLLNYSAIYWVDHYHQSMTNFQAAAAERTRDLCLLEHCRQWTMIHDEYNEIPVAGPLLLASALGLERAVEMFLLKQHSISVDFQINLETKDEKYGRTPLSWAAENGHDTVVKLLLERGADLETKDKYSQTPLLWAAENGHDAVVKLLLEKGADLETKNIYSQTPLSIAAERGHDTVVKLLLEKGADLETKDKEYSRTPLSWAAQCGHDAVVKLLLEKGADLETKDKEYGWTPLLWATANGHDAVVKLLLEKGADLETKDEYSQTSLSLAVEGGHDAVVKLLLEKGADLETKDKYSRTPLLWAAENGHDAVVKLLLERGANLETKDKYSQTPLSLAAEKGHDTVVKLLLEKGAQCAELENSVEKPHSL